MCVKANIKGISFVHEFSVLYVVVGEPKSHIVQKHKKFAPERYTAGFLYTDSLDSA